MARRSKNNLLLITRRKMWRSTHFLLAMNQTHMELQKHTLTQSLSLSLLSPLDL